MHFKKHVDIFLFTIIRMIKFTLDLKETFTNYPIMKLSVYITTLTMKPKLVQLKKHNDNFGKFAFKTFHEVRTSVASILGFMLLNDLTANNEATLEHRNSSVEKLDYTNLDMAMVSYDTEEGKELFANLSDLKELFHNS